MERRVTCWHDPRRWFGLLIIVVTCPGCSGFNGNGNGQDDTRSSPRLVTVERQTKFKPEDFTFVEMQKVGDDGKGGLFGTCLHVPIRGKKGRTWDCELGFNLPIHPHNEEWPRIKEEAERYAARAANAVRKHLLSFTNADNFTCRAYGNQIAAYLRNKARPTWKGSQVVSPCDRYKGHRLPDFYYSRGTLLIDNYREWSKKPRK